MILDAKSAEIAPGMEKAVEVLIRGMREKVDKAKPESEEEKIGLKMTTELIQSHKVLRDGARIEWVGFTSVRLHHLLDLHDNKSSPERPKTAPD